MSTRGRSAPPPVVEPAAPREEPSALRLSVIIPALDAAAHLPHAVESVRRQRYSRSDTTAVETAAAMAPSVQGPAVQGLAAPYLAAPYLAAPYLAAQGLDALDLAAQGLASLDLAAPYLAAPYLAAQGLDALDLAAQGLDALDLAAQRLELQILVVDDGSADDTAALARALGVEVIRIEPPSRGPAFARNLGLRAATGDFIAFLDADDRWPDGKLYTQLAHLAGDPALEVSLGLTQPCDAGGRPIDRPALIDHLGCAVFRRSVFAKVGELDGALRYSEDHDWFLRAREANVRIGCVEAVTLEHRRRPGSLTRSASAPPGFELVRVLKRSLDRRRRAGQGRLAPLGGG